jgi:hypothetical protein
MSNGDHHGHDRYDAPFGNDPTYVKAEIDANDAWHLAFRLSEVDNDQAPIGWSRYVPMARWLLENFDMKPKVEP